MNQQGLLVVVSGFSGAGKGTIMKALLDKYDNYALSVSATTRAPRVGEVHGREYFFLTEQEFDTMVADDAFVEYARYVKHSYGTPKSYVEEQMAAGNDVILEIEIQGALNIKKKFPDALLVFVMAPTAEELKNRLSGRGTESAEVIEERLKRAAEEAEGMESYDYILVNHTVEKSVEELHHLIQSQHMRTACQDALIQNMKKELNILVGR